MRIVAGTWRSRRLARPAGNATRPMPDRVKEAVFDSLGSHYGCPGRLPALHVADVFAGSGSNGLEALSRGAGSCVFFECDAAALLALKENLTELNVGPTASIVRRDAWQGALDCHDGRQFDLVFLDPPYAESEDASANGKVGQFLRCAGDKWEGEALIVLHHRATVAYADGDLFGWRTLSTRAYGTNGITVFQK